MTLPVEQQRKTVSAIGFVNPLNLACNVEAPTHLAVYGNDILLDLGPDYTVEGAGDFGNLDEIAGVNVILSEDVLAEGFDTFTVIHEPPLDQDADLSSGSTLGRIYERALDAIVSRLQSVDAQVKRRIRLPVDSDASTALPHPVPRRALMWDETGTRIVNSLEDPDSVDTVDARNYADAAEQYMIAAEQALVAAQQAQALAEAAQQAAEAAAAQAGDPAAIAALALPVGATILHAGTSAPAGYLKENGAEVSRTTYAALFDAIGTTFGSGNGTTTFNLPESRGEFFRALDDGRGVDPGRSIGSAQSSMVGPHNHTASMTSAGSHSHTVSSAGSRHGFNGRIPSAWYGADGDNANENTARSRTTSTGGEHSHAITINNNSGTETRPRNVARLACIKYIDYTPPTP